MALLDEAVMAGARQEKACEVLGLDARTVQRWRAQPDGGDKRRGPKTRPANSLSDEEKAKIRALVVAPEFIDLSPHQLVAKLADMGMYIASERSFYRELKRAKLLAHRERSKPRTHKKPDERIATGPNQTWRTSNTSASVVGHLPAQASVFETGWKNLARAHRMGVKLAFCGRPVTR